MKTSFYFLLLSKLIISLNLYSQNNVAINTTGLSADPSSILDISSTNTGILIPRVALSSTDSPTPITSPANSLLVYNSATSGTAPNNVFPGYYFWNGSAWVRILNNIGDNGEAWLTNGNSGTNPFNNFIGTTDNIDLIIRTNNLERIRVKNNGNVGINNINPKERLDVNGKILNNDVIISEEYFVTRTISFVEGPDNNTDNTFHTVTLPTGHAANALSVYANTRMDGYLRMQGVDVTSILSNNINWYSSGNTIATSSNLSSLDDNTVSGGTNCVNCTHFVSCPDNYIANGWQVRANAQLTGRMKLRCVQLLPEYSTTSSGMGIESVLNSPFHTTTGGSTDNNVHIGVCPAGTYIKGLSIRADGTGLDRELKVYCTGVQRNP